MARNNIETQISKNFTHFVNEIVDFTALQNREFVGIAMNLRGIEKCKNRERVKSVNFETVKIEDPLQVFERKEKFSDL